MDGMLGIMGIMHVPDLVGLAILFALKVNH